MERWQLHIPQENTRMPISAVSVMALTLLATAKMPKHNQQGREYRGITLRRGHLEDLTAVEAAALPATNSKLRRGKPRLPYQLLLLPS